MSRRGPAVVAALLAVGIAGGYGASLAAGRQPAATGVPTPVAASPSYPVDPEPVYVDDPPADPLPVDLPMTTARLGIKQFRYEYPVPKGWDATQDALDQYKWRNPDNPPSWTYVLRVEHVGGNNMTVARTLGERVEELAEVEERFRELGRTSDTLVFSYVADRHLRVGVLRWVSPSGSGFAEIEVAATGRSVDRPGLEALVAEVSSGVERL
jgi:hypothetical protein